MRSPRGASRRSGGEKEAAQQYRDALPKGAAVQIGVPRGEVPGGPAR